MVQCSVCAGIAFAGVLLVGCNNNSASSAGAAASAEPPATTAAAAPPPATTDTTPAPAPADTTDTTPPDQTATAAPPPPQAENPGTPPSPTHVWFAGSWKWENGKYAWEKGRWEPRREGETLVQPRWVENHGKWEHMPAHWFKPALPHANEGRPLPGHPMEPPRPEPRPLEHR
jgi:hypothetical protein